MDIVDILNLGFFCGDCSASGIIWAWPKKHDLRNPQQPTIFRCHCARGQSDSRRFKIWDLEARNLYQTEEPKWTT